MISILGILTRGTISLKNAVDEVKKDLGSIFNFTVVYADDYEDRNVPLDNLRQLIDKSDIILVDLRGDPRLGRELGSLLEGKNKTVIPLIGNTYVFRLARMGKFIGSKFFKEVDRPFNVNVFLKVKKFSEITKKLGKLIPFGMLKDMRNWVMFQQYYSNGDLENLKNLILLVLKEYGGVRSIRSVPEPVEDKYLLYVPNGGKEKEYDIDVYKKRMGFDSKKPTVVVFMYNGIHFDDSKVIADGIYRYLKDYVNFIFLASRPEYNVEALRKYLGNEKVDIILNTQYFRLNGGPYGGDPSPTYDFLTRKDALVLYLLWLYHTDKKEWEIKKEGMTPIELVISVSLPELDGQIEPFLVGITETDNASEEFGRVRVLKVMEDRMSKFSERVKRWLRLRSVDNNEKRVAIITYNYPPGEENLASAGYLDVFKSIEVFLKRLKNEGYNVSIPDISIKDLFVKNGIANSAKYISDGNLIRVSLDEYVSWFNTLPEDVRNEVCEKWGQPPGNVMVDGQDILIPGVSLGNVFVGVQPSRGVFEDPDKAYHDKDLPPHHQYLAFYFYLQRKFKVDAIIHFGMHGTLEFTKGKEVGLSGKCYPDILIGDIPNIYYYWVGNPSESTIAKRRSYAICISHASPPVRVSGLYEKYITLEDLLNQLENDKSEELLNTINEIALELNLPTDIEKLSKELYKMKTRLIPYGLHIMDSTLSKEEVIDYLVGVLRFDREEKSLHSIIAEREGYDWDSIRHTKMEVIIEDKVRQVVGQIIEGQKVVWLPEKYHKYITSLARNVDFSKESEALLRALSGRYIFPFIAGDPIRTPEVYPTGRGMYAFDPRLIPTIPAQARGTRNAQLLLENYLKKYGSYPETVGIVLWGFETMKTGGDTIATILSLLGVRFKHRKNPWMKDLEVIPLEELGRPRVDVVVTMCGIFRDTFGLHINLLNKAVEMVAKIDESVDMNYVRKHYVEMKDKFGEFSTARIFGPSPTEYATSMRTLIESRSWDTEEDLVKSYDDSMSYAYLGYRVDKRLDVFSEISRSVDIVTQERDNVEYEVTDLDHYYEFLGGLSRSVQSKRDKKIEILVSDTTDGNVEVEDLADVISRSARTRILNPVWIEGMLKHDFHGTKKISDRIENLLGFSATTGKVENWVYDQVADRLIFNQDMREKLIKNNPYATLKIVEILIDATRRGYWITTDQKVDSLKQILLSIEGDIE